MSENRFEWSDQELKDELADVDKNEEVKLSRWEQDFVENICHDTLSPLTEKQRNKIIEIIEEHVTT